MKLLDDSTILNTALVAIGLLIALYTVLMEKLGEVRKERKTREEKIDEQGLQVLQRLLKEGDNKGLRKELKEIWDKKDEIGEGAMYQYNMGFFVSIALFIGSILFIFIYYLQYPDESNKNFLIIWANLFLWGGILNTCYIFFRHLLDMRTVFIGKADIISGYKAEIKEEIKDEVKQPIISDSKTSETKRTKKAKKQESKETF